MKKLTLFNYALVCLFTLGITGLAFMPLDAEAVQGENRGGKGGKQTTAVVNFTETADCSTGVATDTILVGLDYSQCTTYTFTVDLGDGGTAFDEVTANFNISPDGEVCAYDASTGAEEDGFTGCEDGLAEDGTSDGVRLVSGSCTVYLSQPDSVISKNPPPQEPEFILVQGSGECEVTVWVETDLHRGQSDCSFGDAEVCDTTEGDIFVFRPASCSILKEGTMPPDVEGTALLDGTGNPIIDSVNLHLFKLFNDDPQHIHGHALTCAVPVPE